MTSSDYARMKKPCLSSHQKEQFKDSYITPHKTKLTSAQKDWQISIFLAVMREYNVVLGFSSEGAVEGWLHYSPQDQTNFSSEGVATYKGEIIQATHEFG